MLELRVSRSVDEAFRSSTDTFIYFISLTTDEEATKVSDRRFFTTKLEHPSSQSGNSAAPDGGVEPHTAELILLSLAAHTTRYTTAKTANKCPLLPNRCQINELLPPTSVPPAQHLQNLIDSSLKEFRIRKLLHSSCVQGAGRKSRLSVLHVPKNSEA